MCVERHAVAANPTAGYTLRMDENIDYAADDVWERLGVLLSDLEPRPAARCGNVRCEPGWQWRVDLVDYDLWLAVAGQGQFVLGGQRHVINPGTLFWLRPGDEGFARQNPDDPLVVIYVHFSFYPIASKDTAQLGPGVLPSRHIPIQDFARLESLLARIVRLQQQPSPLSVVEARALLKLAVVEAYRQSAFNHGVTNVQPDPRIAHVLQQLHRHPAKRLSLPEAAELANLSPDHFSRLFKSHVGASFRQYSLDVRLDRARHLLEETTLTVSEIAQSLGYDDVFLFSRQCKAHFGSAPTHLRGKSPSRSFNT